MTTKTPYQLREHLVRQNTHLDFEYPEHIEEEHFITAGRDLLELTNKLYLTARREKLEPTRTIYTLWLEKPFFQSDEMNDWEHNKQIALLSTCIDKEDKTLYARILPKLIAPEMDKNHKAKIYQLK